MTFQHGGRFSLIDPGARPAAVVLRHAPRHSGTTVEVVFARVTEHDLPLALAGITIRTDPQHERVFVVASAGRDYRVHAQSLRIHRGAPLYGPVLPQARFAFRKRLLWASLLWSARFGWGQALIRRIRGR